MLYKNRGREMMCPNCGATGSAISFETKMSDIQFWECLCGFEWMVRVPKNITKYKIRKEERE